MKQLRSIPLMAAVVGGLLAAGPATAATPKTTTYFDTTGVSAVFQTSSSPQSGAVFDLIRVDGERFVSTDGATWHAGVSIMHLIQTDSGVADILSVRSGETAAGVVMNIDANMSRASLTVTIPSDICSGGPDCVPTPADPVTVQLTWTATGKLTHYASNGTSVDPAVSVETSHDRGAYRDANAAGTIGDQTFGASPGAMISHDLFSDQLRTSSH
jgi:hypothetical protein